MRRARTKLENLLEISFYDIHSPFIKRFNVQFRGSCMQLEQSLQELEANMTWGKALVYVSSFSYLGGVVATLGGYPLMPKIHPVSQSIFFLLASFLLLSSLQMKKMKWVLSAFYGIAAILSFSGLMSWASYFGGPGTLGPAMAAWDLSLAIALLLD